MPTNILNDVIDILQKIRANVVPDSDMMYSTYETPEELWNEIDEMIESLKKGETRWIESVNIHFLPTSTFQELSIQNGWGDEYIKLADRFDELYTEYKKVKD